VTRFVNKAYSQQGEGMSIRVERFGWVFKKFWKFNIA